MWEKLRRAFPNQDIAFGAFGAEGPITTAWALRGHGFFTDIMDNRELSKEYLSLVTASVVKYKKFIRILNGEVEFSDMAVGLVDDISAMISPSLWPELVVPYLEQYYTGLTSGCRHAHIEDLSVGHLKYLDELVIERYDPSVSQKLTPALIRDNCNVPFLWRLNSTHYVDRSTEDVRRWVFESVADGASGVFSVIGRIMCTYEMAQKVRAFIKAAKDVERLLAAGCRREELTAHFVP